MNHLTRDRNARGRAVLCPAPVRPAIQCLALICVVLTATAFLSAQDTNKKELDEVQKILERAGGAASPAGGPSLLTAPAKVPLVSDQEAIDAVENYLKAIGGREVLTKVTDRTTKFVNTKYSATGETKAVLDLYMKTGYLYREEWDIKGFEIGDKPLVFTQIYNGELEEGWVKMFGTISPLEGRTLGVFVWDKYLSDFFMSWKQDGYTLQMAGKGLVDDTACRIVKVIDFSGRNAVRYFFSTENNLILKKEWTDSTQREVAKKEQYYKKYTRVPFSDGSGLSITFPLRLDIMVDGDLDTERLYSGVKFNSGLETKLFAKPEGVEFEKRERLVNSGAAKAGAEAGTATSTLGVHGTKTRTRTRIQAKKEGSSTRKAPVRKTEAPKTEAPKTGTPE